MKLLLLIYDFFHIKDGLSNKNFFKMINVPVMNLSSINQVTDKPFLVRIFNNNNTAHIISVIPKGSAKIKLNTLIP